MTATAMSTVLIPARPQTLWGWPAVANFALGGLGAGLYLTAVVEANFLPAPALTAASWLGPLLVLAGLGAVATEAGRPLRGARVLARPNSSWMSREAWLGGAFVMLAGAEFLTPSSTQRLLALLAALGFALAQGAIVRNARAVPAWSVGVMPLLFLLSALASGAGLHAVVRVVTGAGASRGVLATLASLAALGLLGWLLYLGWSREEVFRAATWPLRRGPLAVELVALAYALPLALAGAGLLMPARAELTAALAGALMVIGQVQTKGALLLRAGQLRPIVPGRPHSRRTPP